MGLNYGFCINHPTRYAVNAKHLCAQCAKERNVRIAISKGFTIKKKDDELDNTRERESFDSLQKPIRRDRESQIPLQIQKSATFKKAKIKSISKDKANELNKLAEIKKRKISLQGKECEICGKSGEVDLFHIIGVGDKTFSTNETNLMLVCRFCHLVWGANDWSKIVKFKNCNEIMERLKSLDERRYWKLFHKLEPFLKD